MKPPSYIAVAERGITQTLAFFQLFDRGLTEEEVVQYYYAETPGSITESQVREVLQESGRFERKGNRFYLKGVPYKASSEEQDRNTARFLQRTRRYLPLLRHLPFIRMVAVGNTLAFGAVDSVKSDIDLFIVTEANKVWITRLLITILFHILGVRRHGRKTAMRFCLSFYVDETALDFKPLLIKGNDIYMRYWVATLKPYLGKDTYTSFLQQNKGLLEHFPFYDHGKEMGDCSTKPPSVLAHLQEALWWLLSPLAWFLKRLQKKKMELLPVAREDNAHVVVTDHILKFHNNDRRAQFQREWEELVTSLT